MIGPALKITSRKDRISQLYSYYWPSIVPAYILINIDSFTLLAKSARLTLLSPQEVYNITLSIPNQDQTFLRVPKWRMFNLLTAHFLQRFFPCANPKLKFRWRDAIRSHSNENPMQASVPWGLPEFLDGCKTIVSKMQVETAHAMILFVFLTKSHLCHLNSFKIKN